CAPSFFVVDPATGEREEHVVERRFPHGEGVGIDAFTVEDAHDLEHVAAAAVDLDLDRAAVDVRRADDVQMGSHAYRIDVAGQSDVDDRAAHARLQVAGGALRDDPAVVDHD